MAYPLAAYHPVASLRRQAEGATGARWRLLKCCTASLLLAALAAAACHLSAGHSRQAWTPISKLRRGSATDFFSEKGPPLDIAEQSSIVSCTIDAWQAMGRVGAMGLAIDRATSTCKQPVNGTEVSCSADITGILTQVGLVAALLSSAASDCALSLDVKAACASKVLGMLGNLAAVANAGSTVYRSCSSVGNEEVVDVKAKADAASATAKAKADDKEAAGKRDAARHYDAACTWFTDPKHKALDSKSFNFTGLLRRETCFGEELARRSAAGRGAIKLLPAAKLEEGRIVAAREKAIFGCFFDNVVASGFLARVGLGIEGAVRNKVCDPANLGKKDGERRCAVSVLGIIGSFFLGSRFIAAAINGCPVEDSVNAQCARDILGLLGTVTSVVTFSTDLLACEGVYKDGAEPFDVMPVVEE